MNRFLLLILFLSLFSSCGRKPLKTADQAMRLCRAPELSDDLDLKPLIDGISAQIIQLKRNPNIKELRFGPEVYTKEEYLAGLKRFSELARSNVERAAFFQSLKQEFDFYEAYGQKGWGDAFISSYFEPVISGSLKRTERFSQPLYAAPREIISVDLTAFDPKFSDERKFRGRIVGNTLVPYFTREEIDSKNALARRRLELVWVDPLDAFILQIQGSGTIELGAGRSMRLNYANKNGQAYESMGKFLKSFIPADQVNLHTIELYLRSIPRAEMQRYLNMNPSYVFFKKTDESALTYLGVSAVDGRTIATDRRYFPKGALAFLSFEKPLFDSPTSLVPSRSEKVSRFVLDQDIGGAILGGGRVDLFWGRGSDAKLFAGAMKSSGRLYYLAPKRKKGL